MKAKSILTIIAFFLLNYKGFSQKSFNWSDTTFSVGAKKKLNLRFSPKEGKSLFAPYYDGMDSSNTLVYDTLIDFLNRHKGVKIEIASYGMGRNSRSDMDLSNRYALFVKDVITSKGIDSVRVIAKGYGDTKPLFTSGEIAKMKTDQEKDCAYFVNRRFEVIIR